MKKQVWILFFGLLLTASVTLAATLKVITQEATIRKDKRFFAPVVARVAYGEMIQELERQGDWLRVSYLGKEGWIHKSAVQEQKFQLSSLSGERARKPAGKK